MCSNLISIKTKKHKSLGVLTLIFIKLFLQRGPLLSLDEAASFIFEEDEEGQSIFKSKVSLCLAMVSIESETIRHSKRAQESRSDQEAEEQPQQKCLHVDRLLRLHPQKGEKA